MVVEVIEVHNCSGYVCNEGCCGRCSGGRCCCGGRDDGLLLWWTLTLCWTL